MAVDAAAAKAAVEVSAAKHENRNFLFGSRALDFWLLGGLSLAVWIPVYFFSEELSVAELTGISIPTAAFMLAYWVNYPHFMASYKLAYAQGRSFILGNWFQLIFVPAALLGAIVISFFFWDAEIADSGLVQGSNAVLAWLGLDTRVGLYPNLGEEVLGFLIVFMYFTVGWHYAKQAFGCMMVYAKLDGYRLNGMERNLVRYSLLSTWWVTWLYINCAEGSYPFYNLDIYRLNLPYLWFQAASVTAGALFLTTAAMLAAKYRREQQRPSWNFLIPMLALLTWHIPLFGHPEFFYLLGFFHSLQYFPFVAKVEQTRYRAHPRRYPGWRLLTFFLLMVGLGYLAFDWIPNGLDQTSQSASALGVSFFIIAFLGFINIHHYFIDNVLWRFKNKDVRELLFG